MRRMSFPHVVLLVAWGNVVIATVPHLLAGPLRPFPLAHLCWILSAAVVVVGLVRDRSSPRPTHRTVVVGLLTGLTVGIVSGSQGLASVVIALVMIGMVGGGLESGVSLIAITAIGVGFHGRLIGNGTAPAPRPPWTKWGVVDDRFNPNAVMDASDPVQWTAAASYGQQLFAEEDGAPADEHRLTVADGPGPLARVWPEPHAYLNDSVVLVPATLGRGRTGRIVARIWVDPADPAGYPPLGLFPGMNYLWIDGLNPEDGTARAIIVAGDGSDARIRPVSFETDDPWRLGTPPIWANYSRAQWVYGPQGDGLWVSCAVSARCRLDAEGGSR